MIINVAVARNQNENAISLIRRFTRKVQGSGIIPRVRNLRSSKRTQSHYKVKQRALKSLSRKNHTALLIKLGKAPIKPERGARKSTA